MTTIQTTTRDLHATAKREAAERGLKMLSRRGYTPSNVAGVAVGPAIDLIDPASREVCVRVQAVLPS